MARTCNEVDWNVSLLNIVVGEFLNEKKYLYIKFNKISNLMIVRIKRMQMLFFFKEAT